MPIDPTTRVLQPTIDPANEVTMKNRSLNLIGQFKVTIVQVHVSIDMGKSKVEVDVRKYVSSLSLSRKHSLMLMRIPYYLWRHQQRQQ